jgi:hypothetical protein
MMERSNSGKMEKWKNGIKIKGLLVFHHSNIRTFHRPIFLSLFRQGHDDIGVPGAIEV